MSKRFNIIISITLVFLLYSCGSLIEKNKKEPLLLKSEMNSIYGNMYGMYKYILSADDSETWKNKNELKENISNILTHFENIDRISKKQQNEPGFKASLNQNKLLLKNVLKQFSYADNDYLRWRLKRVSANCVTCHTRFKAENSFFGSYPEPTTCNDNTCIDVVDFLISTRQFDQAYKKLNNLIESKKISNYNLVRALKRLLLISVRVKRRSHDKVELLESIFNSNEIRIEDKSIIKLWIKDLHKMQFPVNLNSSLAHAKDLFPYDFGLDAFKKDDKDFIKYLYASAILHDYLDNDLSKLNRNEALLLLGKAYFKMNMDLFNSYPEIFFEQCILEDPTSEHAKFAHDMILKIIELENTGSNGLNVDSQTLGHINDLRELIYN